MSIVELLKVLCLLLGLSGAGYLSIRMCREAISLFREVTGTVKDGVSLIQLYNGWRKRNKLVTLYNEVEAKAIIEATEYLKRKLLLQHHKHTNFLLLPAPETKPNYFTLFLKTLLFTHYELLHTLILLMCVVCLYGYLLCITFSISHK